MIGKLRWIGPEEKGHWPALGVLSFPSGLKKSQDGMPSIISSEVQIRGSVLSAGDLQVEGKIEGDIRASQLVISEKSTVVGDVFAEDVIVRGRVAGNISARKVKLCALCSVAGNILHEDLAVEMGASFEGSCRRSDTPLADIAEFNRSSNSTGIVEFGGHLEFRRGKHG